MPSTSSIPQHYGGDTVYEAIKVIHAWGLGFNLGNCVKYICRRGEKSRQGNNVDLRAIIIDLKKARFYLDYEIKMLEENANA